MKKELLYDGTEKFLYATDNPKEVIIEYKDYLSAFNGLKKAKIDGKAKLINEICSIIFSKLNERNVKTHFLERISDNEQLCTNLKMFPLKFIQRNVSSGTLVKRLEIKEGTVLKSPVYEIMLKKEDSDILINDSHVVNLNLLTYEDLDYIKQVIVEVSNVLNEIFGCAHIKVVDFKLEFGRDNDGNIVLGDEISPSTARLWDKENNSRFDKDRFRKDLGEISEYYQELLRRIK